MNKKRLGNCNEFGATLIQEQEYVLPMGLFLSFLHCVGWYVVKPLRAGRTRLASFFCKNL
jgi:hypothetical protein